MLEEQILALPGFLYQVGNRYYYLGKWICKECTDVDATDCVMMYEISRNEGEEQAGMYFQKIRGYSDFALDIPFDGAKIKSDLRELLDGLSEAETDNLSKQIEAVTQDKARYI